MERGAEELHLLGVGEEAFNTLNLHSSRGKLVRTLVLTLLLPLCFATLVLCLIPGYLVLPRVLQSIEERRISVIIVRNITTGGYLTKTTSTSRGFRQIRTTNGAFEFWMLSTAAVMYTAASIHTANEVSFAKAMTVIPRVWKHLALTLLWFFAVVLAHTTAYIMVFFLLIYTVGFDKYVNSRDLLLGSVQILAVFFCVLVYINMVGYLAVRTLDTTYLHNGMILSTLGLSPHGFAFGLTPKGLIPMEIFVHPYIPMILPTSSQCGTIWSYTQHWPALYLCCRGNITAWMPRRRGSASLKESGQLSWRWLCFTSYLAKALDLFGMQSLRWRVIVACG